MLGIALLRLNLTLFWVLGIGTGSAFLSSVPVAGPKRLRPEGRRHVPLAALQVTIHIRGRERGGEDWIEDACSMYKKRLTSHRIELKTVWHKTDEQLVAAAAGATHPFIGLDLQGAALDSSKFQQLVFGKLEEGGSRLGFVIGGAEGLPPELRPGGSKKVISDHVSLSKMTFTHQMARLLLSEQIYRAAEIKRGSGYHK